MECHLPNDHNEQVIQLYFKYLTQMDLDAWLDLLTDQVQKLMPFAPKDFPKVIKGRTRMYEHCRLLLKEHKWLRFPVNAVFATQVPGVYLVEFSLIAKQKSDKLYCLVRL